MECRSSGLSDFLWYNEHGIRVWMSSTNRFSDIHNIHAILLTKEKTLPNVEAIWGTLKEMETFVMEHPGSEDCITERKSKLSEETDMITKGSVKKILNMRKITIASLLNRFLHEKYGIWIDGELRK